MAATFDTHEDLYGRDATPAEEGLLRAARANGFGLVQFETDLGQLVWAWRRRNEPGPEFVTRRAALMWMGERLVPPPDNAA
jgi:hypothetical protein